MEHEFSSDKALAMLRLLRQSDKLEIGPESQKKIKDEFSNGFLQPPKDRPPVVQENTNEQTEHQILYRIRELVGLDAKWREIENHALQLIKLNASLENKARVLEICVLTGAFSDLIQIIGVLNQGGTDYYALVHEKIRENLIQQFLGTSGSSTSVSELLLGQRHNGDLFDSEYLFIYLTLSSLGQSSEAFAFYYRNDKKIHQALANLSPSVKIDTHAVFLRLATQAFQLRRTDEAFSFTEKIPKNSPLYPDALNLVGKIRAVAGTGNSLFLHPLWRTENWKKRLDLIDQKLVEVSTGKIESLQKKNEINELIEEVFSWLPRNSEAVTFFSNVCAKHLDIRDEIPGLIKTYKSNILVFSPRGVDFALWTNLLENEVISEDPGLAWMFPVAKVHYYWSIGCEQENLLWEAKEILEELWQKDRENCPVSWNNLQQSLLRDISQNNLIEPEEKQLMLNQVMVTGDMQTLSPEVAFAYLNSTPERCNIKALQQLQRFAKRISNNELQYLITLRKAFFTHLTTDDLEILAAMAFKNYNHDLAWRVMTVAKCRSNLRKDLWQAWQLSPENQKISTISDISLREIEGLFFGFSRLEKDIAKFLLLAARPLLEFALKVSVNSKHGLLGRPKSGQYFKYIKKQIENLELFDAHPLKSIFNMNIPNEPEIFGKIKVMSEPSAWGSVLICLLENTGVLHWGGSILYFNAQISSHLSIFSARTVSVSQSPAIAKFIEKMDIATKTALFGLSDIIHKMTDQDFTIAVLKALSRLATALLPYHEDALNTLAEWRAPAIVRWDLENFILSPEYENFRKSQGTYINLPVPKSMSYIGSIADRLD